MSIEVYKTGISSMTKPSENITLPGRMEAIKEQEGILRFKLRDIIDADSVGCFWRKVVETALKNSVLC
jgi:hypothetical protein